MVKIISSERNNLIVHLTDLQGRYNDHNLKHLIETLTVGKAKENEIDKDGNINLHVYSLYKLYHHTVNLGSEENQRRERMLEILNPKLDILLKGVPKFFKDAFENRELYLYSNKDEDLFSFFKNNTLLPLFYKDNGTIRECDELEKIIPDVKNNINEAIKRINKSKDFGVYYAAQEKQKLPFFELLRSMINPEIAQDEKYNYELLTLMINSKLEPEQSRFRAVQLKENKDLRTQDHRLGINWNGNDHTDRTSKNFFSHIHPACLSEKEDYNSSNIKIRDEDGVTKTLDHFLQEYLEVIKRRHRINKITNSNEPQIYSHIFLAEDRQNTNPSPEQKEHARLKLECKAPKHIFNFDCTQNFFIRMAFESTEEPYVYNMTKEGRDEYHYNVIFIEDIFKDNDYIYAKDNDYIYAADDTIQVTEIAESTYEQAMSGVCSGIIKRADQKSYLTMTMHLVPTSRPQRIYTDGAMSPQLISRSPADIDDEYDLQCDGQSSHSRIDITSNPDAQNLSRGRLEASSFKIQSINFDRVSALVANKKLYQVSTKSEQPVKDCIQAMQEKMSRITGKENNLSSSSRPSAPSQSLYSIRPTSPLIGATGGTYSPQYLNFSNINHSFESMDQRLEENLNIPNTPSPTLYSSRSSSPINNFEYVESNNVIGSESEESFEILSTPNSGLGDLYIQHNIRRSKQ